MDTILSIKNLAISIPAQKRNIVDDVSFDIKVGEVVVLSGANGCGKSTIIKAIMWDKGLDGLKIEGSIQFEGSENIIHYTPKQLENLRKKIGYVSQEDDYKDIGKKVNVADCFRISADEFHIPKNLSKEDINDILLDYAPKKEESGKAQYEGKSRVFSLSGGQKRLLTIIANVVVRENASLFLIDEPMNNLDSFNMVNVSNLINSIHRKNPNAAFLIVTHCRVFPFITRRIDIKNGCIDSIYTDPEELKPYDCIGDANEEGFIDYR